MLETIIGITRKYPSTIVIGIISLIIQTAYSYWFMLTVVGIYQAWYSSSSNNSKLNCAMVFLVFSYYWTSQVIAYVTHVTLAGIFATVYFLNDGVKHPIWGSAKRALTTSFGSICFGALLMALINMIRYFLAIARSNTDNAACAFLICIIQCIVNCAAGLFVSIDCQFEWGLISWLSVTFFFVGMVQLLCFQWCGYLRKAFYTCCQTNMDYDKGSWYWGNDQW